MLKGGGLLKNNFNTTQVRKQSKRLLSMFKTLPVFVIWTGCLQKRRIQVVFKNIKTKNSKRDDGMNRLSKEYTTTNNKEKVKAQYTYGKTGGVTLVTNDTSAIANKYDNKGLVMEQKLFEDCKSDDMVYGNNANGK